MGRCWGVFLLVWLGLPACRRPEEPALAGSSVVALTEAIRTRVEAAGVPARLQLAGDSLYAVMLLPGFYERRGYVPAWWDEHAHLALADTLIGLLEAADREGLRPTDYHLDAIHQLRAAALPDSGAERRPHDAVLADLDLLLTDAFFVYASHLLGGRVDPETFDPEWRANRREADFGAVLEQAIAAREVTAPLRGLLPPQLGYARLREALARYRAVDASGGWPPIADGATLRIGQRDDRVPLLRQRLEVSGDLTDGPEDAREVFDTTVEAALRRFQGHQGLAVTGILDVASLEALNVPVGTRIEQLILNLERWRWLPQDLGRRHVLVNIAASDLRVEADGHTLLEMRVVVGRPYRRTPVFSDTMRYLVLNPSWNVPHTIATVDILPLIKRNPAYLATQRMRVLSGWGADAKEIDPTTVEWRTVTAARFPYYLRQDPGPWNALGTVKFMFPNKHNVYLHDTPSRDLFAQPDRTFSSGCIRLERPLDLAAAVLREDRHWTRARIEAVIRAGHERTVILPTPLPVHLLYWTAWADEDGGIHFRRDAYGRDRRLLAALHQPPPE